jgi:hypothetical protein
VTLVAGGRSASLTIAPKSIAAPVVVQGTLYVPPSWVNLHDLALRSRRRAAGAMPPTAASRP